MPRSSGSLKVLHVLRTPVGGLFRHVVDLARGQVARGHQGGLITDAQTLSERADAILCTLTPSLALGLTNKGRLVVLHGFIKKTKKAPADEMEIARKRKDELTS